MPAVERVALDPARVAELTAREEERFRDHRGESHRLWEEAKTVMPRGVPSSFQDTPPQPVYIDRAQGSRIWDVDFHNGFGVMIVGHAHPRIVEAVSAQVRRGTHYAQPVADDITVAAELK